MSDAEKYRDWERRGFVLEPDEEIVVLRDDVSRLRAQNAELVAALNEIATVTYGYEAGVWSDKEGLDYFAKRYAGAQHIARAALAKMEKSE